jgi:hypothetical protein
LYDGGAEFSPWSLTVRRGEDRIAQPQADTHEAENPDGRVGALPLDVELQS